MHILVFNCGSSSLAYKVFCTRSPDGLDVLVHGKAHRVGVTGTEPSFIEHHFGEQTQKDEVPIADHKVAARLVMQYVEENGIDLDAVGHRFVHGGSHFQGSSAVDDDVLDRLQRCLPLAPIHNPASMDVILESRGSFPNTVQYVTFDTAFHSTIPSYAHTYALPKSVRERFGFRRYGFHGLSYSYVLQEASRFLKTPAEALRIVACHLGTGGSSVAAIENGRSVDTSMGYSPLTGLVMSTRCGDIDPMLPIYLMTTYGYLPDDLMEIFNKASGLLGLSGFSSDIRDIINRLSGEEAQQAELALKMYVHRLKKYIGGYVVALGGIDALLFTDDIGIHNPRLREMVCEDMGWCGLKLDRDLNRKAGDKVVYSLNATDSRTCILSVPTDEERVIGLEGLKLLAGGEG